MADDTPKDEEKTEVIDEETGEVKVEKIVIGDVELTPDEAKELVESGKSYKELREQYPDIDFKELPKSFTQARQALAERDKPQPEPEVVEPDEAERRKQIDLFFDDPIVQDKLNKTLTTKEKTFKEDLEFNKLIESLEAEYDGTDGRPKFDKKAVLEYGMKHSLFNPKAAYKEKHEKELDEWILIIAGLLTIIVFGSSQILFVKS